VRYAAPREAFSFFRMKKLFYVGVAAVVALKKPECAAGRAIVLAKGASSLRGLKRCLYKCTRNNPRSVCH